MTISRDRTYKKKTYRITLEETEEPNFDYAPDLKKYVNKLLDTYEFLDGLECIDVKLGQNKSGFYEGLFIFWIDEIDALREELPHLFI